tara:strand:- start:235 stop:483 length:249 start_codon:yes stop_codon:yes gene_type:complete
MNDRNTLGIDVVTRDAPKLLKRLEKLVTTMYVEDGGMYHADQSYSQIHITTTKTADELDNWLYTVNHGCDYVGTFELTGDTQ